MLAVCVDTRFQVVALIHVNVAKLNLDMSPSPKEGTFLHLERGRFIYKYNHGYGHIRHILTTGSFPSVT